VIPQHACKTATFTLHEAARLLSVPPAILDAETISSFTTSRMVRLGLVLVLVLVRAVLRAPLGSR
jgi:hypothetical protein